MFPDVKFSSSGTGGKQYEVQDASGLEVGIQPVNTLIVVSQQQFISSSPIEGKQHEVQDASGLEVGIQYVNTLIVVSQQQFISSSPIEGKQHELLDPTRTEVGIQPFDTLMLMSQQQFITKLVEKCFELGRDLSEKENTIDQMKIQIGELDEKMAVSSIGFDLPEDYYENEEYLV